MSKPLSWLFRFGLMLAVLAPTTARADAPTSSVIVGNGHVTLGVGYDAGLNEAGTGLQFVPTGTEGLAQMCVCSAWSLVVGQAPTSQMVESFTFDDLGARSSVLVDDVATASHLRVTHDFHVAPNTTNLYEVTVTVQNLGGTTVLPAYTRTLVWAAGPPDLSGLAIDPALGTVQPTTDGQGIQFAIGLPPIKAGRRERRPDCERGDIDLAVADGDDGVRARLRRGRGPARRAEPAEGLGGQRQRWRRRRRRWRRRRWRRWRRRRRRSEAKQPATEGRCGPGRQRDGDGDAHLYLYCDCDADDDGHGDANC